MNLSPILLSTKQMLNKLLFTVALNSDQHTKTAHMQNADYGGPDHLAQQSYSLSDSRSISLFVDRLK